MQAITRRTRRNECRQIAIKFLLARFFTLYIAGNLTAHGLKQTPITLIETVPQAQQQYTHRATFVRQRNRDRLESVDRSGGRQLNFFLLQRPVTKLN